MKKLFAILLVCAMVLSMAACGSDKTNEKPSPDASTPSQGDVSPNPDNETTPGGNDATEPSEGWQTKDVTLPTFDTVEVVQKTACEGQLTAKVAQSPWQLEDFDQEAIMSALKASPLFEGWIFGTEVSESAEITNYKEIGNVPGYEWEQCIVATREVYDTMAYASDLTLTFSGDTHYIHGYEGIKLEIDIPIEEVTPEIQDEVYKLLQVIYGEYAEALCYAPVTSGENLLLEVNQSNAIIYLRRTTSKYGLTFNMYMKALSSGNAYREFPGDGFYQSVAKAPQYAYEFLNEKVGSLDVNDFNNIGAAMLKETFEGYTYTSPESTAYRVRYLTLENGHNVEKVQITGNIATEELSGSFAPDFKLEYEVVHNGTAISDVEMKFECGVGIAADGDDEYYAQLKTKFFGVAQKMFGYVLKDELDIPTVMTQKEDGTYNAYNFKTTVCGLEKNASISFAMGPTMAGPVVGYIYFNIQ